MIFFINLIDKFVENRVIANEGKLLFRNKRFDIKRPVLPGRLQPSARRLRLVQRSKRSGIADRNILVRGKLIAAGRQLGYHFMALLLSRQLMKEAASRLFELLFAG